MAHINGLQGPEQANLGRELSEGVEGEGEGAEVAEADQGGEGGGGEAAEREGGEIGRVALGMDVNWKR